VGQKLWGLIYSSGKMFLPLPEHPDLLQSLPKPPFPEYKTARTSSSPLTLSSAKIGNEWSYTSTPLIFLCVIPKESITFKVGVQLVQEYRVMEKIEV
jgi:hypothetical protein